MLKYNDWTLLKPQPLPLPSFVPSCVQMRSFWADTIFVRWGIWHEAAIWVDDHWCVEGVIRAPGPQHAVEDAGLARQPPSVGYSLCCIFVCAMAYTCRRSPCHASIKGMHLASKYACTTHDRVAGMWCNHFCHHGASIDAGINTRTFASTNPSTGADNITSTFADMAPSTGAGDIAGTLTATFPSIGACNNTSTFAPTAPITRGGTHFCRTFTFAPLSFGAEMYAVSAVYQKQTLLVLRISDAPIPSKQRHFCWHFWCRGMCVRHATPETHTFWHCAFQTHRAKY